MIKNSVSGSEYGTDRPVEATGLKLILRAMRYKNYRLFFGGQSISLTGTWMQQVALSWLVYRLTGSAMVLGIIGFANQIPSFLLSPLAGVLADRWNRHRILIVTQTAGMLQASILALLVLTGTVAVWHLVLLALFMGIVNAFDAPARQSFLVEIVEKREDLGNAIALNSAIFNGARLIGPSIAGMLIAAVGEGVCFLINSVSYSAVIVALFAMKLSPKDVESTNTPMFQWLKEGFSYVINVAPIRAILLLIALVSLVAMPYTVLMPIFAKEILHGGPHTLGFLMGASGVGALTGAIYLAGRKSFSGTGKLIPVATSIFGGGLIAFAFSRVFLFSLLLMLLTGFGLMIQMALCNTTLQTIVDDDKRGRVMSFYSMSFMGMAPFGSLLAGGLASKIGAPNTLLIGGLSCIAGAVMFALKLPALRKRPIR